MIPRELNRRIDLRDPRPERVAFARANLSSIELRHMAAVERDMATMDPVLDAADASPAQPGRLVRWGTTAAAVALLAVFLVAGVLLIPVSVTVLVVLCWREKRVTRRPMRITREAYAEAHREIERD